jgi:phosphotransacetylase
MFIEGIRTRVKGRGKRVVFPEGGEERALQAAARLRDQGLVKPVLIGIEAGLCASCGSTGRFARWSSEYCGSF